MRLTLLNQFYAPDISPTAQLAASLAEHRAARGDDVTVLAGRAGYLEGLASDGLASDVSARPGTDTGDQRAQTSGSRQLGSLRVRRVWTPRLGRATALRRLLGYVTYLAGSTARLATMPRQDVIVAMTTPPYVVVVALLHRMLHRRTRVVLWSMDCYPDAAERFGALPVGGTAARILRAVNRWAFRRVDHVVALDGAMADLLAAYTAGPDRPPISVIPNWERADLFPAEMFDAEAGRGAGPEAGPDPAPSSWPSNDGRAVIVYLGNTGVGHRFDTVLRAAAELADEADFVFVGGGARWRDLTERVAAERLGNVVLQGYVPKEATPGIMAGATAALITLDDRALGVMSPSKLHANLAAGLPVLYVGPPGSNVDEAIAAHGCGISLRNGDVAGLIEAVRALRDPGRWAQISRAARAAFDTDHSDRVALARFDVILDGMGSPLSRR